MWHGHHGFFDHQNWAELNWDFRHLGSKTCCTCGGIHIHQALVLIDFDGCQGRFNFQLLYISSVNIAQASQRSTNLSISLGGDFNRPKNQEFIQWGSTLPRLCMRMLICGTTPGSRLGVAYNPIVVLMDKNIAMTSTKLCDLCSMLVQVVPGSLGTPLWQSFQCRPANICPCKVNKSNLGVPRN